MKLQTLLDLPHKKDSINTYLNELAERKFGIDTRFDYSDYIVEEEKDYDIEVFRLYEDSDGYRGIWIYVAYFKKEPIMIWRKAGRSGKDHFDSYPLNKEKINESIKYLETLCEKDEIDIEIFDVNEDNEELDYFYGTDMTKVIEKPNLELKFKTSDIVKVKNIQKAFPEIKEEEVFAKILIRDSHSKYHTYDLELIGYKIYPFFSKNKSDLWVKRVFKETDVLSFSDISNLKETWEEYTEEQQKIIIESIGKRKPVIVSLRYAEEDLLTLVDI